MSVRRGRERAARPPAGPICVVGPGTRFISGITYYTFGLANALARHGPVSVVLLRSLLPARLYPGAERVGSGVNIGRKTPISMAIPASTRHAGARFRFHCENSGITRSCRMGSDVRRW